MVDDLKVRRNLLKWAKDRARRKGLEFDLTVDDISIPNLCPVLKVPLCTNSSRPCGFSPSLDRIDPTKGYIRGNVIVVSYRANRLKSDASLLELLAVASFYSRYLTTTKHTSQRRLK